MVGANDSLRRRIEQDKTSWQQKIIILLYEDPRAIRDFIGILAGLVIAKKQYCFGT